MRLKGQAYLTTLTSQAQAMMASHPTKPSWISHWSFNTSAAPQKALYKWTRIKSWEFKCFTHTFMAWEQATVRNRATRRSWTVQYAEALFKLSARCASIDTLFHTWSMSSTASLKKHASTSFVRVGSISLSVSMGLLTAHRVLSRIATSVEDF